MRDAVWMFFCFLWNTGKQKEAVDLREVCVKSVYTSCVAAYVICSELAACIHLPAENAGAIRLLSLEV